MAWHNGEWYDTLEDVVLVRDWCPTCDPDGVPGLYTMKFCILHWPRTEGTADAEAQGTSGSYWSSGSCDAEGETNARWCQLLHRQPE
jgi:hypothetical protein